MSHHHNVTSRIVHLGFATAIAGLTALASSSAWATNGFLSHCTGANNCGMGGAGIALPQDASSAAINPALMGRVSDQVFVSPGWFAPDRYRDLSNAPGGAVNAAAKNKEDSQVENFMEGAMGVNYNINDQLSLGLSIYGSGGMHTKYTEGRVEQNGAGDSTVRYRMAHAAPTITYKPNETSAYGLSAIIGYADFKSNFATLPNFAETTGNLVVDRAYGYGFRLGGLWDVSKNLSVGATASTPIWFQEFDKYDDLFLGSINTPANAGIGLAWRMTPDTDVALDAKYVAWGTEKTLHARPGSGGFGWDSKPVFAVGVQHRLNETWTLRAGYNYGPMPVPDDAVFANAMFPAVTEHHMTVGASYKFNDAWSLSGSFFYAPESTATDEGSSADAFSAMGSGTVIGMTQMGAQVGVIWNF